MTRDFQKNSDPKNLPVAKPTVGRIVLFYMPGKEPLPAIVTEVDDTLRIKALCVFTPMPYVEYGTRHISSDAAGDNYWDWMPFQKGQAAKTEELERQLKGATGGPSIAEQLARGEATPLEQMGKREP